MWFLFPLPCFKVYCQNLGRLDILVAWVLHMQRWLSIESNRSLVGDRVGLICNVFDEPDGKSQILLFLVQWNLLAPLHHVEEETHFLSFLYSGSFFLKEMENVTPWNRMHALPPCHNLSYRNISSLLCLTHLSMKPSGNSKLIPIKIRGFYLCDKGTLIPLANNIFGVRILESAHLRSK